MEVQGTNGIARETLSRRSWKGKKVLRLLKSIGGKNCETEGKRRGKKQGKRADTFQVFRD